jgi:peptide/nickel transport system permease protein
MTAYIIRRLFVLPFLLFGITLLIFALLMLLHPRERATLYITELPRTSDGLQRIIDKYGLNDPIHKQYWRWLKEVLHGNLGFSRTAQRPVKEAIGYYLPATAELALAGIGPMVFLGIWLGIISAVHHNEPIDHFSRVFSLVGWSFPTFVFGLLMLMIFYAKLGWFPAGRLSEWATRIVRSPGFTQYTHMNTIDALLNLKLDVFWDAVRHLFLPVVTLTYLWVALLVRIARSSMLEVLRQDYVVTARAKGLKESTVINRHARPNAMIPVATVTGFMVLGLMTGVVITETVFNYRGMGWWLAQSAQRLDVISVLGFALFAGVLYLFVNLGVDVVYAYLDPRVRLQ